MVGTAAGLNIILRVVNHIHIASIKHPAHVHFGLIGILNADINPLKYPLALSDLTNLYGRDSIEVQNLYDMVCSDMIAKSI